MGEPLPLLQNQLRIHGHAIEARICAENPDNNFLPDTEVMNRLGAAPKEIPVMLVYDDIELNFPTRYAMYDGKTLGCTGDGETARWRNDDASHPAP